MPLSLRQIIPPSSEPVSVPEVKALLRIETNEEDGVLADMISAAREDVEIALRRQLLTATLVLALDDFPTGLHGVICLPRPPIQSVTHIRYLDSGAVLQTLDSAAYQVDTISEPGRIWLADGQTWPSVYTHQLNAVLVTYVAGWPSAFAVPAAIRHAIKLRVGDLYEHREARLDIGAGLSRIDDNPTMERFLWRYRLVEV